MVNKFLVKNVVLALLIFLVFVVILFAYLPVVAELLYLSAIVVCERFMVSILLVLNEFDPFLAFFFIICSFFVIFKVHAVFSSLLMWMVLSSVVVICIALVRHFYERCFGYTLLWFLTDFLSFAVSPFSVLRISFSLGVVCLIFLTACYIFEASLSFFSRCSKTYLILLFSYFWWCCKFQSFNFFWC